MQKSSWGGLGAWMLALAIGLVSSGWPELIRPHPRFVIGLAIAGAIMFVYPGLKWVYQQQKEFNPHLDPWKNIISNGSGNKFEASPVTNSGNFAGRDNLGKQIIAEHYHEAAPIAIPVAPSSVMPPVTYPITITIGPVEKRCIEHGRLDRFKEGPAEKIGALAWITNERTNAQRVSDLGISLVFRRDGAIVHQVNRSFWFGITEYERDLNVGTREAVLVCMCYGNTLGLYSNSRKYPLQQPRTGSALVRQLESFNQASPEYIIFDSPVEVEIAAISSGGETLGVSTYLLTP
jgi:hypothetical protein